MALPLRFVMKADHEPHHQHIIECQPKIVDVSIFLLDYFNTFIYSTFQDALICPAPALQYHSLLGIVQIFGHRNPAFFYRPDTPFRVVCECIESK